MQLENVCQSIRIIILMYFVHQRISGKNLALRKNCLQSSLYSSGMGALNAADGDKNQQTYWRCSHTNFDKPSWWAVNLQDVYEINNVVIFGRTDCCADRLSKFFIEAINSNIRSCSVYADGSWSNLDKGEVSVCHYQESSTAYLNASCKPGTVGQFLRIRLTEQNHLSLCEVEVYGHFSGLLDAGRNKSNVVNIRCGEIGSYYTGQLLEKYYPRSVVECLVICTRRNDCYAVNYNAIGKECDLMRKNADGYSQFLVKDPTWRVYFNV